MLGNLFPNTFGNNGDSKQTSLAPGSIPQLLNGREREDLNSFTNLPTQIKQSDVNNAAKKAGELEAQTVLLREGSTQYLEVQKATLANLEVRVNHSQQAMKNNREFQKKMSKHGKNIYEFQVGTEASKANFDAYEAQFNGVTVDI